MFIKAWILRLYTLLLKPKSNNEDIRRREFILNLIITGSLILVLWSNIVILLATFYQRNPDNRISLTLFSCLTAAFVGLYILSRQGKISLATYGLIILYLLGSLYGTARWGATLPAILLSYALIITLTSVLISSRAGLFIAIIIIASILGLSYEEIITNTVPAWRYEAISFMGIAEYGIILIIITLISWLSNREIEKSLLRARTSEKALKQERDSLEATVAERSRQLELSQTEKMTQLYQFAEFGRLSSGLFHDVINPLTAINLNLQTINNTIHPDLPLVKEDLNRAITASDRMEKLITTIGKQFRASSDSTRFSVKTTIEETLNLFSYRSRSLGITIISNIAPDISLTGNAFKFQQIITNICSNAFDSYEKTPAPERLEIHITAWEKSNVVYISITDYGQGISPEFLPHIFDAFFSTKPLTYGLGLGLSMVKRIINEDFKGEIKAESNKEQGTTFTISIPNT